MDRGPANILLIDPVTAPAVPGWQVPQQLYWVLAEPAPLAGMQWPRRAGKECWKALFAAGFRWVLCLSSERPRSGYDPVPLEILQAVELTDLDECEAPAEPEREEALIRSLASAIVHRLKAGEGVVVHCAGGRGRTGTVLGVVLRNLGLAGSEVVGFLDKVHRRRGTHGWPEAHWQREVVQREQRAV